MVTVNQHKVQLDGLWLLEKKRKKKKYFAKWMLTPGHEKGSESYSNHINGNWFACGPALGRSIKAVICYNNSSCDTLVMHIF